MKRATFLKAIELYHDKAVKKLMRRGIEFETASDAVQEAVVSLLSNKSYKSLDYEAVDGRVLSYLTGAAKGQIAHAMRKVDIDRAIFASLETDFESEDDTKLKCELRDKDIEEECPFCFVGVLNQYKACSNCGTILGQGKTERERITLNEADLASLPNLDMSIDVANAVQKLNPLEQCIIRTIANGSDTLDGLADSSGMSRDTLWRTYVRAKRKLQAELLEYAVQN